MTKVKDMTGRRFGRLKVLAFIGIDKHHHAQWHCQCDCGQRCAVTGNQLRRGMARSCGCLRIDVVRRRNTKHGHSSRAGHRGHPLYSTWLTMKTRCYNPKNRHYRFYGLRGVKVCARWRRSFAAFLKDMGPRPPGKTLDRWPDPAGDYKPSNCQWSTLAEQIAHRRARRWGRHPIAP